MSDPQSARTERLAHAAELRAAGALEDAAAAYRALVAADPLDAAAHHHLAGVLARLGDLAGAEGAYRRAMALAPQAWGTARALGVLLLRQGRYAEGFALFEARHHLPQYAKPDLAFPEWRGEPLAGKRLLIWPEQGLGDQIQFARFARTAHEQGAQVTLLCWAPLARLFAASLPAQVLAAQGAVAFEDPDYWVMSMSLAARFGASLETLPAKPYLVAPGGPAAPPRSGDGPRIGLMARGAPGGDATRALSEAAEAALRALPGQVIGLSPEETGARDFADTAGVIAGLDLVIAVDTAVAHLAGAMGKPCWVLLSAEPDWRWLDRRTDSPWYPSVRLYRQPSAGDWDSVVAGVRADLAAVR